MDSPNTVIHNLKTLRQEKALLAARIELRERDFSTRFSGVRKVVRFLSGDRPSAGKSGLAAGVFDFLFDLFIGYRGSQMGFVKSLLWSAQARFLKGPLKGVMEWVAVHLSDWLENRTNEGNNPSFRNQPGGPIPPEEQQSPLGI